MAYLKSPQGILKMLEIVSIARWRLSSTLMVDCLLLTPSKASWDILRRYFGTNSIVFGEERARETEQC